MGNYCNRAKGYRVTDKDTVSLLLSMVSPLENITEAEFKGKAHASDTDRITHLSLVLKYTLLMFQI